MQNYSIRTKKLNNVVEYITNAVLPLKPGERTLGIRAIMKETGAGRRTVMHALDKLILDGIIKVEPKRGIFKRISDKKSEEIRLLHWGVGFWDKVGFMGSLIDELSTLATKDKRTIVMENISNRSTGEVVDELIKDGIDNCIILGAMNHEYGKVLSNIMSNCLELLPRHTMSTCVTLMDSPIMTKMQCDYLINLGYTRIGYIHICGTDISRYPIQVVRLMEYYRIMAEKRLFVDPKWVFQCDGNCSNIDEAIEQIFSAMQVPQVLIVPGYSLKYLYPTCKKAGIKIGKDIAIFSCDESDEEFVPEVTHITNNPREIGRVCWNMFSKLCNGETVESCYTDLRIKIGKTVPRIKD